MNGINLNAAASGRSGVCRRAAGALTMVLAIAGLSACDSLLEVDLPGDLTREGLDNPRNASLLVTSTIANFECGMADWVVTTGGLERSYRSGTGWNPFLPSDAGTLINIGTTLCGTVFTGTSNGYTNMQQSRVLGELVYGKLTDEWTQVANRESLLATAATYVGANLAIFGESFCRMTLDEGPELSPAQVRQLSEEWLTRAIGHAQAVGTPIQSFGTDNVGLLARQLRARVRLASGNYQGAASDAEMIPHGFLAEVTRSNDTDQRRNPVVQRLFGDRAGTVHETMRNLTVAPDGRTTQDDGVPDPRVPVEFTGGTTQNANIPLWTTSKYTSVSDPIPFAKWQEAQLILAEVAVQGADAGKARQHLNNVRDFYELPHVQTTDLQELMDQIIDDRRREFFLEGRHHGDMIRYGIPFQSGTHPLLGIVYGDHECFDIPIAEINSNPNVS